MSPTSYQAAPPRGKNVSFESFDSELFRSGGDDRDRTGDLLLAKQALSQLSYAPKEKYELRIMNDEFSIQPHHSNSNFKSGGPGLIRTADLVLIRDAL